MSSSDSSRSSGSRRWLSGLLVTGLTGVLLAVAANWYAAPRLAEELFRRTPVDAVLDLEDRRVELTRRFTLAMLAGMIGPAADGPSRPPEPDAPDVPSGTPEYTIERGTLNKRLRKPDRVRDKIAVVPDRRSDGKSRGLRILELDGWFGEFGLHVGDVVRAINGARIRTRQQAVGTLLGMRDQTTFTLDVLRRDKPFQIRYHVPHGKN